MYLTQKKKKKKENYLSSNSVTRTQKLSNKAYIL